MYSTTKRGEKRKALVNVTNVNIDRRPTSEGHHVQIVHNDTVLATDDRNIVVCTANLNSTESHQPFPFIVIPQHIWEKAYLCVFGSPDNVSKWIRQPRRGRRLIAVAQYPIANDGEGRKGKTENEIIANITDFVSGESDYFDTDELA